MVDFEDYKVDADSTEKITQDKINQFMDAVENALNNIENDQIPDDEIALAKFEGGGVPESDITIAGSSGKLLKTTSAANIVLKDGAQIITTIA